MSAQNPVDIVPFDDPFSFNNPKEAPAGYSYNTGGVTREQAGYAPANPDAFGNKITDWLGITDYKGAYERWKVAQDREYERQATNSARAWDLWMDSTQYQRRVNDLLAAGLNPWLAVQSGLNGAGATTTASQGSSARYNSSSNDKSNKLTGIAMMIMSVAKLISVLAA